MQLVTMQTAKRVVGRLRPHFLSACMPVGLNCSAANYEYVVDYTCSGNPDVIREAR